MCVTKARDEMGIAMAAKHKDGPSDKLEDFEHNPSYERRVVAYYDILGWRAQIEKAGKDPAKIGELRRIMLLHSRLPRQPTEVDVKVSTFSDNVVISFPPGKSVPYFLRSLACFQLMTANRGFLMRGGIAIGDLVHDSETVFGPGLIR